MSSNFISTSQLAKQLNKPSRELFALLADSGWIVRIDNQWQPTAKGRFEGARMLEHSQYGSYVAWPQTIVEHPMLSQMPAPTLSASRLGKALDLPGRLINLLLCDLSWIKPGAKGWLLTDRGRTFGGVQLYADKSAVPYVNWPEGLLDNPQLIRAAQLAKGELGDASLSGRAFVDRAHRRVDSWLYLHGLHYRYGRGSAHIDLDTFYFPKYRLHILLWPEVASPAKTAQLLGQIEAIGDDGDALVELTDSDINQLDEILPARLLPFGIGLY